MSSVTMKYGRIVGALAVSLVALGLLGAGSGDPLPVRLVATVSAQGPVTVPPVVFVSRAIPARGTVYWDVPKGLPGVQTFSRFQVAAPGRLLVRESNGTIRTLVDGAVPTAASLNLIDVNGPDVSFDGQTIVFAGLAQGTYSTEHALNPGAWRIFAIDVDGTNLRQVTRSDRDGLDLTQFGWFADVLRPYDDHDPAWMPDGRIVFSSTRFPGFAQYGGSRTTNLYVVNADGSNLHRITGEKNGADRPVIDPLTGRVVYSRWWRNFRLASQSLNSDPYYESGVLAGYKRHLGLVSAFDAGLLGGVPGGPDNLLRNHWHLGTVNPDGTDLRQFAGASGTFESGEIVNHAYGGAFGADGAFYANFFPMKNGTEAAGFGGIKKFPRGAKGYEPIIGVTSSTGAVLVSQSPPSYGVYQGAYATDPTVLTDGRLVISWAPDVNQDYGLYVVNADGTNLQPLYNVVGRTELRARVLQPRPTPPIIPDSVTRVASLLPPGQSGPYDVDGTFTYDAMNVYFNAPVDTPIVNAVGVGQARTIRFYLDHQRQQSGSVERLDWPILLNELPVNADGSIDPTPLPANLPAFEQLRSDQPSYQVPRTGRGTFQFGGAAHVAGLNFGRTGATARCVGCHVGHSMIPVPATREQARWTNLAPGATIRVSSTSSLSNDGLVDRRALTGSLADYWRSDGAQPINTQWVELEFPRPVFVRTVRLYDPRNEGEFLTDVNQARVSLYALPSSTAAIAQAQVGPLSPSGTDVPFADVRATRVRVELLDVVGTAAYAAVASLAEVEVIASVDTTPPDADTDGLPDDWELRYGLDPSVSNGDADDDGDGRTNAQEYQDGTHPRGFVTRYFAEGATGTLFSTNIELFNPGSVPAYVLLRFLRDDGGVVPQYRVIPAHSRIRERVNDLVSMASTAFATVIESDELIVAARDMRWDDRGYGSHTETALLAPATTWYLAEGATHSGFNLFYLIQNSSDADAVVDVEYLLPAPSPSRQKRYTVPAHSRVTVWVNHTDPALAATDVSAVIRSTNGVPIAVERSMYLDAPSTMFNAGHGSAGITAPATEWFLAEGATGSYFDMFILLANPGASAATVHASYLLPDGTTIEKNYQVAPRSRFNIWVDQEGAALADTAVSTRLVSTNGVPIVVERAMWWPGSGGTWQEAHNAAGVTSTGTKWAVAQGEVGGGLNHETYLLVANTSPSAGTARVTIMLEDGSLLPPKDFALAANSRLTVATGFEFPALANKLFGAVIESIGPSPVQLVVECATYSDAAGVRWAAGSDAVATKLD